MDKQAFSNEQVANFAHWLKIIGEPNRLLLLEQIIEGVQCNCELGEALRMAPNLISHHLSVLREAGLVDIVRDPIDGRCVYYSINQKTFMELKSLFNDFFDLDRFQPRRLGCGPQGLMDPRQTFKIQE